MPDIVKHPSYIGDIPAVVKCERCEGELLDSKVEIEGGTICWITWGDRESFFNDLNQLISKYRI